MSQSRRGLTLFEIIIGITLLVVISGLGIIAYNPAGQMAASRNRERELHLQSIMIALRQNIADSVGNQLMCAGIPTTPPTTPTLLSSQGGFDIAPCLLPTYLSVLPYDPFWEDARFESAADYNLGYTIVRSATSGVITLAAPFAELEREITLSR